MHKRSKKLLLAFLSFTMLLTSFVNGNNVIKSSEKNELSLGGLVPESDTGHIDSKSLIVSEGNNNKVNYRITPSWTTGTASGVNVFIKLPSITYKDGEYKQTHIDDPVSDLGIRGKVTAGNGWNVIGDTVSNGGVLQLEYIGGLSAGVSPAFDIELSTYTDGTDGPYGSIPEGMTLELMGYTSYEAFNGDSSIKWETSGKVDPESIVKLIVSGLDWNTSIKTSEIDKDGVYPIWDRYQYMHFDYTISNTSDNKGSIIEGFDVVFNIDSLDINGNGILPYDINRFKYVDNKAVANDDINDINGEFIGVPDKGGILIYDITDWDGVSDLDNPIPYRYSGSGSITLNQSTGDYNKKLGAKDSSDPSERKYLIGLPLSRQGFPDLPTNFNLVAITNVLFAKGSSWTKTTTFSREVSLPDYNMSFEHKYEKKDVVFGYDTHFTISNILNESNVPIFNPSITYDSHDKFELDYLRVKIAKDKDFAEDLANDFLTYLDINQDEQIIAIPTTFTSDENYKYFDIDLKEVDKSFKINFKEKLDTLEKLNVIFEVYGKPLQVGDMSNFANLEYIEKIASNDDLGNNTTYTDVIHNVSLEAMINVIFPEEVIPNITFNINGSNTLDPNCKIDDLICKIIGEGVFNEEIVIDYIFSTNNQTAKNTVFEAVLNEDEKAIKNPIVTLKKELFNQATNIKVSYVNKDNNTIELPFKLKDEDTDILISDEVIKVIITFDTLIADSNNLVSISGKLDKGILKEHYIYASLETYQDVPYDQTLFDDEYGLIKIKLPMELNPEVDTEIYYGLDKGNKVSYESIFRADFSLDTFNVQSPNSTYTIELDKASGLESFSIEEVNIEKEFMTAVKYYDKNNKEYLSFNKSNDIVKIVIEFKDIETINKKLIASLKIKANVKMGETQGITATFKGNQNSPFFEEKTAFDTEIVEVVDTKTKVIVEGVNQVNKDLGVGNDYSVSIYKHWNRGSIYSQEDYTLDQGYKSLGGFTNTIERPSEKYENNDQRVTVTTHLPEHFDLYYMRIREEAKDYLSTVKIYRVVNGKETLWQEIDGSLWTNNTLENNMWRINTALYENNKESLFSSHDTKVDSYEHPYFKSAWHTDVNPEYPISKVEVVLDFKRLSEDELPQMAGKHDDLIEYMGRFFKTSSKKEETVLNSEDIFGENVEITRNDNNSINSLVGYSYAEASTGVFDKTTTKVKEIEMGQNGEYLVGLSNKETFRVPYYGGHGPDVYIPAKTEHDEWLQMYDSSFFHDTLTQEFIYPSSVNDDPIYHYDSKYFVIENNSAKSYISEIRVYVEDEYVSIKDINFSGAIKVNYIEGDEFKYEVIDNEIYVSLNDKTNVSKFEIDYKHIQGFGERTAKIAGTKEDDLGGLNLVDVRIGGLVQGNKDLVGKTNLYRHQDDSLKREKIYSSEATLRGVTPKIDTRLKMSFDKIKVYDFESDGLTPNKSRVDLSIENHGQAMINKIEFNFKPDKNYRSEKIMIPKEIFDNDWKVTEVLVDNISLLDKFILENDYYVLDLLNIFDEGLLKTSSQKVNDTNLIIRDIRNIKVVFTAKDETIFLAAKVDKPTTMIEGSNIIVEGIWTDQSDSKVWDYNSKPTFTSVNQKVSNEVRTSYSNFNVSANVEAVQTITISSGNGNQGKTPTLTLLSNSNRSDAPILYNRVSRLKLDVIHYNNDLSINTDKKVFYDSETNKQISYNNITVGDTAKLLFKIENGGSMALDNNSAGQIKVLNPNFTYTVPKGLKVNSVEVLKTIPSYIEDDKFKVLNVVSEETTDKSVKIEYEGTLDYGESTYVFVEVESINDFSHDIRATQNKTVRWNALAKPANTHNIMSYDGLGVKGNLTVGTTNKLNKSIYYAEVYNDNYVFSNPNKLKINSSFNEENISNKEMTIKISDIKNETLHSNTNLKLHIELDKNKTANRIVSVQGNDKGGFELLEFPVPESMPDYQKPIVSFKYKDEWILVSDYNDAFDMSEVNELLIDYGIVNDDFIAPDFEIKGIGHWKTINKLNNKNYNIPSTAEIILNHANNSEYTYKVESSPIVYKAIAEVELNLQAYDTKEAAKGEYIASEVGKNSYKPNETFYYKTTVLNHSTFEGVNTKTANGKADLLNPVIFDKIPEYLSYDDFEILIFDKDGVAREFNMPTITVDKISGVDVGGDQTFNNTNSRISGEGLISSSEPNDLKNNPAKTISYDLITFNFENEDLKRGERLEIVYKVVARENDLPYAKYKDQSAIWAPYYGAYSQDKPVSKDMQNQSMDMASLLHDIGLSGNRGHELTHEEFLLSSYSWAPGSIDKRLTAGSTYTRLNTYYDKSADKDVSHTMYLKEEKSSNLYVKALNVLDEVYQYIIDKRVNDLQVVSDERILWAQNGMQLSRAWLYGASEILPDQERSSHGIDDANFYEKDGNLHNHDIQRYNQSPYAHDDYTYAVDLHELFTIRLHGINMGDRNIESGLEYLEILPEGISPYDEEGNLLGVKVFNGSVSTNNFKVEVVQSPENDQGYRSANQNQEARTYSKNYNENIPYVVKISVYDEVSKWFNSNDGSLKYQYVDLRVRVDKLSEKRSNYGVIDDIVKIYDELTIKPIAKEEYLEIYSKDYGVYSRNLSTSVYTHLNKYYKDDAISEGLELLHARLSGSSTTYLTYEPYGLYISGLNARNTKIAEQTLVTGDKAALRRPTLRTWINPEKVSNKLEKYGNIDNFQFSLYDEIILHATIENQQLEVREEYNNKNAGYAYQNTSQKTFTDDIYKNAPQTIGGAKGSLFEPKVEFILPKGMAPVLKDGTSLRYDDIELDNDIDFSAVINDISSMHEKTLLRDVSEFLDVDISIVDGKFKLVFTVNTSKMVDVKYLESLVISPRVKVIDNISESIIVNTDSSREGFNPIVSNQYTTGDTPSTLSRDLDKKTLASNDQLIAENDRLRLDSSSEFKVNEGQLKINDRLIKATDLVDNKVFGELLLIQRNPSIYNNTKTLVNFDGSENDLSQVDPAGKHYYLTEVSNKVIVNDNPYIEAQSAGDIAHSRFEFNYLISNFAKVTEKVMIKKDGVVYKPEDLGFRVDYIETIKHSDSKNQVRFIVTPPKGEMKTNDSYSFIWEVILVDGFSDAMIDKDDVWKSDDLIIDSYVSLITDDYTVREDMREQDFAIQDTSKMNYVTHTTDELEGFNVNGRDNVVDYAYDTAEIEIIKPKIDIRKNTLKPRIKYSNGLAGDNYYKTVDDIEYLINHVEVVGSGIKELVVEDILPTDTLSEDSINISRLPIDVKALFATTGKWLLPDKTLEYLDSNSLNVDDYFKVFIYYSEDPAVNDYELDNFKLLNPGGTSIHENKEFKFEDNNNVKKIRVILRALKPEELLVPRGTKLAVDADPDTDVLESVIDIDPDNLNNEVHPDTVVDNSIRIGLNILSEAPTSLFIYNNAQAWANYVGERFAKLDQSETRSYLTPSRPVVNIHNSAKYFRYTNNDPDNRFNWSDNTTINHNSLPHLKFSVDVINADKSMWDEDENTMFEEDALLDPFITIQIPKVIKSLQDDLKYIDAKNIDENNPLHDSYKSNMELNSSSTGMWTYRLIRSADNIANNKVSKITLDSTYTGPWKNIDQNVLSIGFKGNVYPGDRVVVEYIAEVVDYAPEASDKLVSIAKVSNNTGMLSPLNSRKNSNNILGYELDNNDLNSNKNTSDRLVFSEKILFTYEKFDTFGKFKTASSDLNKTGTSYPEATPVSEGGNFTYKVTVDNAKSFTSDPYVYPMIYDVLPHVDDTSIINNNERRDSHFNGEIDLSSINLSIKGSVNKEYVEGKDYTVYLGPFKMNDLDVVKVDLPVDITQEFFDDLKTPLEQSAIRDEYFITLENFNKYAKGREKEILSVLVMFNDPKYEMPGDTQITLEYDMKARINAPVWLQNSLNGLNETFQDYSAWNSFVATQKINGFKPQESNRAGVYVTELKDKTYFGNYVWEDRNYDGIKNEGVLIRDINNREILLPKDGYDPGINGVKVSLKTALGYPVDKDGNAIHFVDNNWVLVDETSGETILDDTFLLPIVSEGPLVTYTEDDYNGNAGYYVFSNITEGEYKVVYEFDSNYDKYGLVSDQVYKKTNLSEYVANDKVILPVDTIDHDRLVVVSDAFTVTSDIEDDLLMSFDIGIAKKIKVGGSIFEEDVNNLNGYFDDFEKGLEGYHVYLKNEDGSQALDINNKEIVTRSDINGNYEFDLTPFNRNYYIKVTDENDTYTNEMIVSPYIYNNDPFKEILDNDGYTVTKTEDIITNMMNFDLKDLERDNFADRLSVSIGIYEKSHYGVIGNRVWEDLNKNGKQDFNESGIENQELHLEQYYVNDKDEIVKTNFTKATMSNIDGYYYFDQVPTHVEINSNKYLAKYRVLVKDIKVGYNITIMNDEVSYSEDNDFRLNGQMLESKFITLASEDSEGNYDFYNPINDNSIDLGLHKHELGSVSGEVFSDLDNNGLNNEKVNVDENLIISLQVKYEGSFIDVYMENDVMLHPSLKDTVGVKAEITANKYEFNNLLILDESSLDVFEYRVVINGIPLYYSVSDYMITLDETIDNNFKEDNRSKFIEAKSNEFILSELIDDSLIGVDTNQEEGVKNIDLGLHRLKTRRVIGNYIWQEESHNGIQDDFEKGIANIEVSLYELINNELVEVIENGKHLKTFTDEDGKYEFEVELSHYDENEPNYNRVREYVVIINRDSNMSLTEIKNSDDLINSDFINLIDSNYLHNLNDEEHLLVSRIANLNKVDENDYVDYVNNEDDLNIDAGLLVYDKYVKIGGYYWSDENYDGKKDSGELGLEGREVRLYKYSNVDSEYEYIESVKTNVDGYYEFIVEASNYDRESSDYLKANRYLIDVDRKESERFSPYTIDSKYHSNKVHEYQKESAYSNDFNIFNDGDISSVKDDLSVGIAVKEYRDEVVIGGIFWNDINKDGYIDSDEDILSDQDVILEMYDEDLDAWNEVSITLTDESGYYEFVVKPSSYDEDSEKYLIENQYRVVVKRLGNQDWTSKSDSTDNKVESLDLKYGVSEVFKVFTDGDINSAKDDRNMHIGIINYQDSVIIGDEVKDDKDSPIKGAVVSLEKYDPQLNKWFKTNDLNGNSEVISDEDGKYSFTVMPKNYILSKDYLTKYEYRTVLKVPSSYVNETKNKFSYSKVADINTDGVGSDLENIKDDLSLDFTIYKEDVETGVSDNSMLYIVMIILMSILLLVFRKKKYEKI